MICLIGGGGFIGSHMRARLARRGCPVTVVARSAPSAPGPDERFVDIGDSRAVAAMLEGRRFEAVVDLASGAARNWREAAQARHVDDETASLSRRLAAFAGAGVGKYVYFSTGGAIYGDGEQRPHREEDPLRPLSPYGQAKRACEDLVRRCREEHGLPAIVVRPSNVYGPGQQPFIGQGIIASAFGLACRGEPVTIFGDGLNVRDYLHVDDLCDAIDAIVAGVGPGETLNIGSGEGVTLVALMETIGELAREKGWPLRLDFQPARSVDVRYSVLDAARLRALTQWRPATGLRAGLAQTRDWIETFLSAR